MAATNTFSGNLHLDRKSGLPKAPDRDKVGKNKNLLRPLLQVKAVTRFKVLSIYVGLRVLLWTRKILVLAKSQIYPIQFHANRLNNQSSSENIKIQSKVSKQSTIRLLTSTPLLTQRVHSFVHTAKCLTRWCTAAIDIEFSIQTASWVGIRTRMLSKSRIHYRGPKGCKKLRIGILLERSEKSRIHNLLLAM